MAERQSILSDKIEFIMEPTISIIIPVFNTEKYLPICIQSIINQTYKKLEIILVNDGSTDNSGALCEQYANSDSRIKVIHQVNQRQAVARNNGINCSTGDYIMFIDSDDYVALDICEYLLNANILYKSDLAVCETIYINNEIGKKINQASDEITLLNTYDALKSYVTGPEYCGQSPCAKLYKRSLIGKIRFTDNKYYEDTSTIYKYIAEAKKITYLPEAKYYYVQRDESTMYKEFSKNSFDKIEAYDNLEKFLAKYYPDLRQYANVHKLGAIFYCLGETYSRKLGKEYIREIAYARNVASGINTTLNFKRKLLKTLIQIDYRLFGIIYKLVVSEREK